MSRRGKGSADDDPSQLRIDWTPATVGGPTAAVVAAIPAAVAPSTIPAVEPLVQRLPWDFKISFPQPTDDAIDNGVLDEADREPENLKSLHENYARQCLATLVTRDKVMDAKRKGIDPDTGNKPRTHASRERLRKYLTEEPGKLEHAFDVLIGTYADAFGRDAADAFKKAIIAWHAGIDVVGEDAGAAQFSIRGVRFERKVRANSQLPVPKPLSTSVAAGMFGRDENGKPIKPDSDEVWVITKNHAEKLIELLQEGKDIQAGITKYAEDFGERPAKQLEAHVRRQLRERS